MIPENQIMYRHATIADANEIREILDYYIRHSMATWRYEAKDSASFAEMIRNHQKPERPFWVAVSEGQIIGYSCLSDFRGGEGYWPCAENSVYIRPGFEKYGVGSRLMQLILDEGRQAGLKAVIAAIDAENENSIRFHQKFGFQVCGHLKEIGYKNGTWRSLTFMQCDLQPIENIEPPAELIRP